MFLIHHRRKENDIPDRVIEARRAAAGWVLASLLLPLPLVGCGNSGEGTARISPEARERLTPHVDARAKGRLQKVAGKSLGIKHRAQAGPTP